MRVKSEKELTELVTEVLVAAGAEAPNASMVAQHLVLANLSGVDSHGVWHLMGYVKHIQEGQLVPTAQPEVIKETPASVLVSGNWTFGQVAARFTMDRAIAKAKLHDMAIAGLVQSNHIGRVGHYTEMAAAEGMISMICLGGQGNQNPTAVPFGGREAVMHTNPIAMGFPGGDGPPMFFDFATTAVAGVKVVNAQRREQELPAGCIVDKDGAPTTDPNDFFDGGGHLAFGGHKGYALMMAVEYLGRIFVGSDTFINEHRGGIYDRYSGTFMMVLKADMFQPFADFAHTADEMGKRIRQVAPAPGFDEVLVPGDIEAKAREVRRRDGIPIEDDVWETIVQAADAVGIKNI
ncbi:MAG: Ldh family oxidoreductase [Candidatus Poribacteria bacterium]|nr:Ldh family oxidoreductase [Candidatus Poribacteria bacterium]